MEEKEIKNTLSKWCVWVQIRWKTQWCGFLFWLSKVSVSMWRKDGWREGWQHGKVCTTAVRTCKTHTSWCYFFPTIVTLWIDRLIEELASRNSFHLKVRIYSSENLEQYLASVSLHWYGFTWMSSIVASLMSFSSWLKRLSLIITCYIYMFSMTCLQVLSYL